MSQACDHQVAGLPAEELNSSGDDLSLSWTFESGLADNAKIFNHFPF
jgi:hypothetical protein